MGFQISNALITTFRVCYTRLEELLQTSLYTVIYDMIFIHMYNKSDISSILIFKVTHNRICCINVVKTATFPSEM